MPDRYSFARALACLANPSDPALRDAAHIEIAASEALADASGTTARGLIVPGAALARAQSTQTAAEGGALVGQAATGFSGALRAALVTGQAGATVLTGLRGDASVPTLVSGAAAYWLDEDLAQSPNVTDSIPEMVRGLITPRTVAASIPVSRRMMLQAQPNVTDLITADLLAALGHEIDAAALGASTDPNAPAGLRQALAGQRISFAAGIPSWSELLDMEQDILDAHAADPAFVLAPVMARALKASETETGSGRYIMTGGKIADRAALTTPAMSPGEVIAGGFSDLVIALFGGIDLRLDAGSFAASDTRVLRAFADVGFLIRRKASFAYGGAP